MMQALGYSPSLIPHIAWHTPRLAAQALRMLMPGPWSPQTAATIGQLSPTGSSPRKQLIHLGYDAVAQLTATLADVSIQQP